MTALHYINCTRSLHLSSWKFHRFSPCVFNNFVCLFTLLLACSVTNLFSSTSTLTIQCKEDNNTTTYWHQCIIYIYDSTPAASTVYDGTPAVSTMYDSTPAASTIYKRTALVFEHFTYDTKLIFYRATKEQQKWGLLAKNIIINQWQRPMLKLKECNDRRWSTGKAPTLWQGDTVQSGNQATDCLQFVSVLVPQENVPILQQANQMPTCWMQIYRYFVSPRKKYKKANTKKQKQKINKKDNNNAKTGVPSARWHW